jgi:hypothetical protein
MPWSRHAPLCRFNNPGAAPVDQRSRFQASQQDALATPHFSSPLRRPKRCARRPRETALRGRFQTPRQDVALFLDNLLVLTPLTSAPRSRSQDGGRMPKENCTYLDAPPPREEILHEYTHTLGVPTPYAVRGPHPAIHPGRARAKQKLFTRANNSADHRSLLRRLPPI